jgi:cytoskeletal protein RodZ
MAEIGSTLREARMRARIDISEVEVGTKIRAKYLRALENEEWDLLPGPVYVKSFLKTYGDFLGLDTRLLVDEYKRRYERPSDHERPLAPTARERDRRRAGPGRVSSALLSPRSVIVVALVVIVAALMVIGSRNGAKSPGGGGNSITPATNTTGSRHHHHAGGGNGAGGTTTTSTQTASTTTTTTTVPKRATLALVPTSTVWICVENQAGKPLMTAADYAPGQTIPTLRAQALLVTLGNTSVTMTANGKPYPLSGGNVTSLRITAQGVSTSHTVATCR